MLSVLQGDIACFASSRAADPLLMVLGHANHEVLISTDERQKLSLLQAIYNHPFPLTICRPFKRAAYYDILVTIPDAYGKVAPCQAVNACGAQAQ